MSQKLPVNDFKCLKQKDLSQFNENFIKNYDKNSNTRYFFEVDIHYLNNLFDLHKDWPFLPESKKVSKVEKLICDIGDKNKSFKTSIK